MNEMRATLVWGHVYYHNKIRQPLIRRRLLINMATGHIQYRRRLPRRHMRQAAKAVTRSGLAVAAVTPIRQAATMATP